MADEQIVQPTDQELFQSTQVPQPEPKDPAALVTDPALGEQKPVEKPVEKPVDPPAGDKDAAIPSWRLREEADARRAAETRAAELERRYNEVVAHLRQNQPKPAKTDFFENPDGATEALIAKALAPYAEETRSTLLALGRMVASTTHGADKVEAAEKAFLDARAAQTLDVMDYEKVVQSANRYDAVVQWHKRQNVLASVGDDPAAWFERQLAERLADPKFQAQMLEKVRAGATANGAPGAVVLPPSLSRSTAVAPNRPDQIGDMSDASLWAAARR